MNRTFITGLFMVMVLIFSGCKPKPQTSGPKYGEFPVRQTNPVYHFAIHPLYNPVKMIESYEPLMDYLNGKLKGAQLTLEASRDYFNFEQKLKGSKPEFLLPNPWQTLQAIQSGYTVIAMAGAPTDFKGLIIVRKDGGIRKPSDLKGKSISYPSPTALAACIMPQYLLHSFGINVNHDIENKYVGSQESSIMNVFLKITAAGATWPPPWRIFQKDHPEEASALKVIWETESLINNSVMARNDIPASIRDQVQKYLFGLHETEPGRSMLFKMETSCFLPASNKDYEVVQVYVERFEKEIRKVETR
ncbi:MAG: phosphate/phosphite/phosphonate ABC transporter substrate-binding protein [Prolixibacteraceae bacterium]|nr:phosphate/phosphite/phosphonate ABC transporter substrate-binding protein [Prolixibacteraceae bacterium]